MAVTIKSLLARGDYVAVEAGRLVITPKSGEPVPNDWLKKHLYAFMREIARTTGIKFFQYERYSVGKFGRQNFEGILLDYTNIATSNTAQVFFNCDITRARTTKAGKQGEPLPLGQFRVRKKHAFTQYWLSLGLPLPRLSEFHYCMGKLGAIYVIGEQDAKNKIDKTTLKPISLNLSELKKAFSVGNQVPDKYPIKTRQLPDNYPIRTPDKETAQSQSTLGLQANSSTDKRSALLSNQVSACKAMPLDSLSLDKSTLSPMNDKPAQTITATQKHISDWMENMERDHQARQATKSQYRP